MQTIINIKPTHYDMIKAFFQNETRPDLWGTKMQALYSLIQKKGEVITVVDGVSDCEGLRALEIKKGEFIAIKRTGAKDKFYPCVMKYFYLQSNN